MEFLENSNDYFSWITNFNTQTWRWPSERDRFDSICIIRKYCIMPMVCTKYDCSIHKTPSFKLSLYPNNILHKTIQTKQVLLCNSLCWVIPQNPSTLLGTRMPTCINLYIITVEFEFYLSNVTVPNIGFLALSKWIHRV